MLGDLQPHLTVLSLMALPLPWMFGFIHSLCVRFLGQLKQQKYSLSQPWRLEVQDQGVGRAGFSEASLLAVYIMSSPRVLTWPSLCAGLCPDLLFLQGHWSHWIRACPYDLIYLHHLFKGPHLQMQSPSEVLGIRTPTYEFEGDTIQPITNSEKKNEIGAII